MRKVAKYIAAAFFSVAIFGCIGSSAVAAETEIKDIVMNETVQVDMSEFPSNDELFAGYVERVLYDGLYKDTATYGNMGELRLPNEESKIIYRLMKQKVEQIAAGECATAEMNFEKCFTWNLAELGSDIQSSLNERLGRIDFNAINKYLLQDCPYDLYWYDKTTTWGDGAYDIQILGGDIVVNLVLKLPVAAEYGVEGGNIYDVNTQLTKSVVAAKNKAQSIVEANKGRSDYQKMLAYKDAICEMTSYNNAAADNMNTTPYGNPWQLIWVFDEDEDTKVVCEGYAKAFQYLCDLSGLTCYSVSGNLSWGIGAGLHMWNVVTLDGSNYLVDVTNCDLGSVGYPDKLFLAGTDRGNVTDGYTFTLGYEVSFSYDSDQISLIGAETLTLSSENYTVKQEKPESKPVTEVFVDIVEGAWYVDSVQYVYDEGIIVGDGNIFAPDNGTTRAMVAMILYRLAGSPKVTEADYEEYNRFGDLPKEKVWYSDAIAWALKEKVSTGDDYAMLYNPESFVTREQLALFLWRYATYTGEEVTVEKTDEELFGDTYVNSWAKEGFAWAVDRGIIKGAEETDSEGNIYYVLNPQGGATRAQFSKVLQRIYDNE